MVRDNICCWALRPLHPCPFRASRQEDREDSHESKGKEQEEVREDLPDRPAQPTGSATSWHTQPPRIPTGSAT
eukprot:4236662-Pyramimonas_sp.AAC.1